MTFQLYEQTLKMIINSVKVCNSKVVIQHNDSDCVLRDVCILLLILQTLEYSSSMKVFTKGLSSNHSMKNQEIFHASINIAIGVFCVNSMLQWNSNSPFLALQ